MGKYGIAFVTLIVGLTAISTSGAASWNTVRGRFERTFTVNGPVELQIKNGSGDITVREGGPGSVEVRAKIYSGNGWFGGGVDASKVHAIESNPPVEQFGGTIRIKEPEGFRNVSIDYEISVPANTRVRSETGSGDVTVEGISGPAEIATGSGDVKIRSVHGNIRAETGSGDARLQGIDAERVEVKTGSGDVDLRELRCALQAETGSGDVQAEGRPTGHWRLNTGSGEVTLHLPSDLGFDLAARSDSGDVHTSGKFSITVQGAMRNGEVHGKVRGGGIPVDVQTGSGDITID
ncbi:MAG TPA: DUF4097 family beta strand repeat-containing protein [Terriglobia bacterium]|nr:DUF4097 family beta strand repeat-containing protein [Terriglobia bacterium]